jgi:hypothetical protein
MPRNVINYLYFWLFCFACLVRVQKAYVSALVNRFHMVVYALSTQTEINIWEILCMCVRAHVHACLFCQHTHFYFHKQVCFSEIYSNYCVMNFILSCVGPTLLIYEHKITMSAAVLLDFDYCNSCVDGKCMLIYSIINATGCLS